MGKRRATTFGEIVDEARRTHLPTKPPVPGAHVDGKLVGTDGSRLVCVGRLSPEDAQDLVARGAAVGIDGCGCLMGLDEWLDDATAKRLADVRPRLSSSGNACSTGLEQWESDTVVAVVVRGDVAWGRFDNDSHFS